MLHSHCSRRATVRGFHRIIATAVRTTHPTSTSFHSFATKRPPTTVLPRPQLSAYHRNMSTRKPGVASPAELQALVDSASDDLIVLDVRNPDASVEPGDQKSLAVAGLPDGDKVRPRARHVVWDRSTNSMDTSSLPSNLETPIITHCGGGGRGQKAKEYLEQQGYTNVLNGGGPKETECWAVFGNK